MGCSNCYSSTHSYYRHNRPTHSKKKQSSTVQPSKFSKDRVKVANVGTRSDKTETTFENEVVEIESSIESILQDGCAPGGNTLKRHESRPPVTSEKCLAGEKCTFHPFCLFVHDDGDNDQLAALQRNIVDVLPRKRSSQQLEERSENVEKILEYVGICPIGGERKRESEKVKEKQERQKMTNVGDRGQRAEAKLQEGGVPSGGTLRLAVEDQSEIIFVGKVNSSDKQEQQEREEGAVQRPVSNLLMLKAKEIKEKREEQERMKAITLHPFYNPPPESHKVGKRSEHQESTGEDKMSTEEIGRSSEMRNKRDAAAKQGLAKRIGSILEDGGIPREEIGRAEVNPRSVPKVAQSSVHQELTGKDRIRSWRNKSEKLLESAIGGFYLPDLLQASSFKLEDVFVDNLCKALEKAIFALFPSVGAFYSRKVRAIVSNVKGNPELRTNLLTGVITPEELASMSTEEMASSEMKKKKREEAAKQGLVERVGSSPIYSRTIPTWQFLTDRQLDKEGESRLGQSDNFTMYE